MAQAASQRPTRPGTQMCLSRVGKKYSLRRITWERNLKEGLKFLLSRVLGRVREITRLVGSEVRALAVEPINGL